MNVLVVGGSTSQLSLLLDMQPTNPSADVAAGILWMLQAGISCAGMISVLI